MPEGDTIHRVAAVLAPVLEGRPLVRLELPRLVRQDGRRPSPGTLIESVAPVGKHLLIGFEGGVTLRTHLRMTGSWHVYRVDERWRRPRHRMRALVGVDGWDAVCFDAPLVALERTPRIEHLGPDLAGAEPDIDACVDRIGRLLDRGTEVADALRDQRVACGIGNVYASEICFAHGLHPRTPIEQVDVGRRRALIDTAATMLRANLGPGPRTTVAGPPGSLAVYGRAGRPCRRCATPVQAVAGGRYGRMTYWCPTCQPVAAPPP